MFDAQGPPFEPAAGDGFRLGDLHIDPAAGRISGRGSDEQVDPRVMDVLVVLARRPGELVTREAMLDAVWPDRVLSENALSQCVYQLREHLARAGGSRSYRGLIETLPKRGYRLNAEVSPDDASVLVSTLAMTRPWRLILLAVLAVALALLVFQWRTTQAPPAPGDPSLAVLPFAILTPADEFAAQFAEGFHDDLLVQLARISGLKLIARSSVLEYRDASKGLREIGHELGVATLMEGSVRLVADQLRLNLQLIDVESDSHLWAKTYDVPMTVENILAVKTDIARAVTAELRTGFFESEATIAGTTDDLEAYRAYLTARSYDLDALAYIDRTGHEDLFVHAESGYRQAIERDPGFALAHAALGRLLAHMWHQGIIERSPERREEIRSLAEHALALVPGLAEAHVALAYYHYYVQRDYERALDELAHAESRVPGLAEIHRLKGLLYRRTGNWQAAAESLERASQLEPRNRWPLRYLYVDYVAVRQYDRALAVIDRHNALEFSPGPASPYGSWVRFLKSGDLAALRREIQGWPDVASTVWEFYPWMAAFLDRDLEAAEAVLAEMGEAGQRLTTHLQPRSLMSGLSHQYAGRPEAAPAAYRDAESWLRERLAGGSVAPQMHYRNLAFVRAGLGDSTGAIAAARRAVELLPVEQDALEGPLLRCDLGIVYAMVGEEELAITTLDAALSTPAPYSMCHVAVLSHDPRLERLHENPEFRRMLDKHRR